MKQRTILLGVGALIAIGIIMSRKEKLMDENNEDFNPATYPDRSRFWQ